ncbi:MAG TPA: RRQRL motif-containing zinc-binding protein [Kineosporiaceae bacterium]|nr:RRQRL motif-containing zinc-binding protein [Kineosporiaceae bacterium]
MTLPTDYPAFRWLCAPAGYATRRQLAALGLRPGGMEPVARITWRRGRRIAYLYPIHLAVPKRPATPTQLRALARAMTARRTCRACGRDAGYCLPRSWSSCLDCQESGVDIAA